MRSYVVIALLFAVASRASARYLLQDATASGNTFNTTAPSYPSLTEALTAANTTPAANLSTLMAALSASGLDLSNITNVTILAPNDAAFEKRLPALGLTPAQLLAPENNQTLVDILSYHVIPGVYTSSNLTDGGNLTTLQGTNVTSAVDTTMTPPMISFLPGFDSPYNATVVVPDIQAGGNVIHVIDDVLVPAAISEQLASASATAGVANATAGVANTTAAGIVDALTPTP